MKKIKDIILAIDQGTSGTTCLAVDTELNVIAKSNMEFEQHFPRPGWVEHRPEQIWDSVCLAVKKIIDKGKFNVSQIAGIGITNQRETILIWDKESGKPIYNAIVWQDRRTSNFCDHLKKENHQKRVHELTGLILDPYFSATKLSWLLKNIDGAAEKAKAGQLLAGTIDTYLLWKLTGGRVHATEASNASRTMLWELEGNDWSDELCDLFKIPEKILPEVKYCNANFGTTRNISCLPDGIPIHGILGDQQSAMFAQACFRSGQAKCTYGTGGFVMLNTGNKPVYSNNQLLTTIGWKLENETIYALEGSSFMAGAVVQWLRDGLGFFDSAAEVEALAQKVDSSNGVVLVPAHSGLGAPYWNSEARGSITGITRGTTKAHIARAALEGISLQIMDLLRAMERDISKPLSSLKVDGGAAANNLLMQMQADFINLPVQRPEMQESTALGAVFMAGLGMGVWSDLAALEKSWKLDREFKPSTSERELYIIENSWRCAVDKLLE
jgi:glycerol kinase